MALNRSPAAARNLHLLLRNASPRIALQFARYQSTSAPTSAQSSSSPSSVSSDELKHFSSLASSWWDPLGPSRILHLMNPIRHDFIASCLADSTPAPVPTAQAQAKQQQQQRGLKYLDVGCGGGIFAESLARTIPLDSNSPSSTALSNQTHASSLLAIDPSPDMIELALQHGRKDPTLHSHLQTGKFGYANTTLEDLASSSSSSSSPSPSFDVVTLFEVLEHVDPHTSSPRAFVEQCLRLVAPGGWLIGSTIARTWPSYVINQVIAEAPWPIGVVPPGTHEWSKFVNPDELKGWAEDALVRDESRTKSTTVREAREGAAGGGGGGAEPLRGEPVSKAYTRATWKCVGTVYAPGLGWKLVPGSESWGNYFWGIQKLEW